MDGEYNFFSMKVLLNLNKFQLGFDEMKKTFF